MEKQNSYDPLYRGLRKGEKKERKQKPKRSRFLKTGFEVFKDGLFNCEPAPWGYNWLLGYCEAPQNFTK